MGESEQQTRRKRIDPKLQATGWKEVPFTVGKDLTAYDRYAIEECPTENGFLSV